MIAPRTLLRRPARALALAAGAWLCLASTAAAAADDVILDPDAQRYRLGQGLQLGDSGFRLGGYGYASYADAEGADNWSLGLDALSGFLWWDNDDRWRFFSEVELSDAFTAEPGRSTTNDAYLGLERFYVDYARRDELKLRLGKFLTPVGRWNLIHAAPLTWTTSRPLITEATFPTNATGAMVYGVLPWTPDGVEYSLYASPGEELLPNPDLDTFTEAYGGHLSFSAFGSLRLGVSALTFELEGSSDARRDLYGFDFAWSRHRFEVSGEFAYRVTRKSFDDRDEQGLYLQAVIPFTQKLYGVLRYENFRSNGNNDDLNLYLGGLNYRIHPFVVLKAEFSDSTENDLDVREGALASVAVQF